MHHKMVALIKQVHLYVRHFPRFEQRALTERILNSLYATYEAMIEAQKPYNKTSHLNQLDKSHEKLRMLVSLAHELGYFGWTDTRATDQDADAQALRRFHTVSVMIDDIGRQIGGWRNKFFKSKTPQNAG